jgi:hypothetical protein
VSFTPEVLPDELAWTADIDSIIKLGLDEQPSL